MSDEKTAKIIQGAAEVFMKYGVKSINMDDMARHLGISKKTLYQHVRDKEDLVARAVDSFCTREDAEIRTICLRGLNAIDESLEIMKWVLGVLKNVHPSVSFDIEKYHPDVFYTLKNHRHRAVFDCMLLNMRKGQREGLYRKDFNADIIARMYIVRLEALFDPELFPYDQFKPTEVYMEIFRYHIAGIASPKGLEYLHEKMKSLKTT